MPPKSTYPVAERPEAEATEVEEVEVMKWTAANGAEPKRLRRQRARAGLDLGEMKERESV